MNLNRENAEKIHELITAMFDQVNEVLFIVNSATDVAFRQKTQRVFATVIAELDLEVLEPIYRQFPELRPPDMDAVGDTT